MAIPPRRQRKQKLPRWADVLIRGVIFFLTMAFGFFVSLGFATANYLAVIALCVLAFFFMLGFNIANIRDVLPGLSHPRMWVRLSSNILYVLAAMLILTVAAQKSDAHHPYLKLAEYKPPSENSRQQSNSPPTLEQAVRIEEAPVTPPADEITPPSSRPRQKKESEDNPEQQQPVQEERRAAGQLPKPEEAESLPVTQSHRQMTGKITRVMDANVLEVDRRDLLRLIGVSVPDAWQQQAAQFMQQLVLDRTATIEVCPERPYDQYGRLRAIVYVNNLNLNTALIEQGYSAVQYVQPCHIDLNTWRHFETKAREKRRGIWQ